MVPTVALLMLVYCMTICEGRIQEPSCNYMDNLERLLEKYVRYEHKLAVYSDTLVAWETKLDARIKDLDTAEAERNQQTSDMKANVEEMKLEMKETLETLQRESGDIEGRMDMKETEIDQMLATALQKLEADMQSLQETYGTPTVFFTSKDLSSQDYKTGDVLKFTTIVSNIGDGYDSSTGNFTAPHSGLYMFTTTLCSQIQKNVYAQLMAAGTMLASTYTYNQNAGGSCTSISGVAKLSKDERAWVQAGGYGYYTGVLYSDTSRWPSFAGMLVHL